MKRFKEYTDDLVNEAKFTRLPKNLNAMWSLKDSVEYIVGKYNNGNDYDPAEMRTIEEFIKVIKKSAKTFKSKDDVDGTIYESVNEGNDNDIYFKFLTILRDSGKTNMFGAAPYLQQTFGLSKSEARSILSDWMKSFNESVNEGSKNVWKSDDVLYVDSDFLNDSKGKLPNSELKHLGMGDFILQTSNGNVVFTRTAKTFKNQSGRAHEMTDNVDGKLIDQLIKAMRGKIQNESVNEGKIAFINTEFL